MKLPFKTIVVPFILAGALNLSAYGQYSNFKSMSDRLYSLAREYPQLCSVKSLVKTQGGKDILIVSIGSGDRDNKPAIAIAGGVEGSYLAGKELAAGFAEKILKDSGTEQIKNLLSKVTFYILPDLSPDASEQFFGGLKYERIGNARSVDDDRDFLTDEDPFEDLNNDGFITLIRVADPTGTFIESTEDKRLMVQADLGQGQTGKWSVYSEGTDNDKDGKFNEDGQGGVSFNRNFTYNYESFGLNSGLYPVSEPESKAVADFLYDHFNIYTVITFGPQDNLGQPWKAAERPGQASAGSQAQSAGSGMGSGRGMMPQGDRRITSVLKADETINKLVSDKYHELTGVKGAPPVKDARGNFMEWAYYHYGRYSFSTPAWWINADKGKNYEAAFLKFAARHKMNDVFVPWTKIEDPDFKDKLTEVGGIKPFAVINPPADTLGELINVNYKFITAVAGMHPELEFTDITVENAGENVFRVALKVHNKGVFATCAAVGEINSWTRIMRIALETGKEQSVVSGQKIGRIGRLNGGESAEFSWLITGKGTVKVSAGAANTGIISTSMEMK